jgi:hypothetical protein
MMEIPNDVEGKIAQRFTNDVQDALQKKGCQRLEGACYNAVFNTMYNFMRRVFYTDAEEREWIKEHIKDGEK